ncbi:glutaredoxin [bacterium]|jgi:glutaredoxin|nr:glutaredoxin [bacterium]
MKPELYYFEACPYCKRVKDYIESNSLQNRIVMKEVRKNKDYYKQLIALTQDDQVPCLSYRDDVFLDSQKIMNWIEKHLLIRR